MDFGAGGAVWLDPTRCDGEGGGTHSIPKPFSIWILRHDVCNIARSVPVRQQDVLTVTYTAGSPRMTNRHSDFPLSLAPHDVAPPITCTSTCDICAGKIAPETPIPGV